MREKILIFVLKLYLDLQEFFVLKFWLVRLKYWEFIQPFRSEEGKLQHYIKVKKLQSKYEDLGGE